MALLDGDDGDEYMVSSAWGLAEGLENLLKKIGYFVKLLLPLCPQFLKTYSQIVRAYSSVG